MTWLQLESGAPFNLQGPGCPVSIGDIAGGLAKINRFAGATRVPYSVAQHSVLVSKIVKRLGGGLSDQLDGLLHDAHEIALSDIPSPVKQMVDGGELSDLERGVQYRIICGLHLGPRVPCSVVRQADLIALATEKRDLMAPEQRPWTLFEMSEPDRYRIKPVGWKAAKRMFIERFEYLTGRAG